MSLRKWSDLNFSTATPRCTTSHTGRDFCHWVTNRFCGNGLYLLDEPGGGRCHRCVQLSFLTAIHDLSRSGSQLIIATHSPIIMAYPNAVIYWFSEEGDRADSIR